MPAYRHIADVRNERLRENTNQLLKRIESESQKKWAVPPNCTMQKEFQPRVILKSYKPTLRPYQPDQFHQTIQSRCTFFCYTTCLHIVGNSIYLHTKTSRVIFSKAISSTCQNTTKASPVIPPSQWRAQATRQMHCKILMLVIFNIYILISINYPSCPVVLLSLFMRITVSLITNACTEPLRVLTQNQELILQLKIRQQFF